jgi:hypothetical protein
MGDLNKRFNILGPTTKGVTSYILKLVQFKQVSKSTQVSIKFQFKVGFPL